jgi:hypothetical protein
MRIAMLVATLTTVMVSMAHADYDPNSKDFECRFDTGPMAEKGTMGFGQTVIPSPFPEWDFYFELPSEDIFDRTKYRIWVGKKRQDGWGNTVVQYHGKVVGHGSCRLAGWADPDPVSNPSE